MISHVELQPSPVRNQAEQDLGCSQAGTIPTISTVLIPFKVLYDIGLKNESKVTASDVSV